LVCWHAQLFEDKWIRKIGATEGIEESPLGSPDMSSLIDLNSSYQFAKNMRLFPFGMRALVAIAVAALLPMIPLILVEIPLKEILRLIANTFL
jgi:hypothetical protein